MKISEIFYSIQGEGELTGVPSVFVRTCGCNLRCVWCDTPYASWEPEGENLPPRTIASRAVDLLPAPEVPRHLVLTGGEPLIAPGVVALTERLAADNWHLTVETSGNVYRPVTCHLMSISPKLAHSTPWDRDGGKHASAHESRRLDLAVLQRLIDEYRYQLKFVVRGPEDLDEVQAALDRLQGVIRGQVHLMPEGTDPQALAQRSRWIVAACQRLGFRYCPRLHVELFGNVRGT